MDMSSVTTSMNTPFVKCPSYHLNKILICQGKKNIHKICTGIFKRSKLKPHIIEWEWY